MRLFIGVLIVLMAGFSWAESDKPKFGEASIFSDSRTKARLQPAAEVCLKGADCAGNKVGAEVIASNDSAPKTAEEIYQVSCMGCHASGIAGAPKTGDSADWNNRLTATGGFEGLVMSAIKGKGAMPPNGTCANCSADDIKNVVQYILDQSDVQAGAEGAGAAVNDQAADESMSDVEETAEAAEGLVEAASESTSTIKGDEIYTQRCSVCHGQGIAGAPKTGDQADWSARLEKGIDVVHQNALQGINGMPPKGGCMDCSDEDIKAAVEYMVEASQ